jgi:hypothetical protein
MPNEIICVSEVDGLFIHLIAFDCITHSIPFRAIHQRNKNISSTWGKLPVAIFGSVATPFTMVPIAEGFDEPFHGFIHLRFHLFRDSLGPKRLG